MFFKYPKTWHLPWSENKKETTIQTLDSAKHFKGTTVVVTEKMDGENTSIYSNGHTHARSISSGYHKSRELIRKLAGEIAYTIPKGWRICGENMYAKHSIHYTALPDHFLVFSVWKEDNTCLSWKDTLDFCKERKLNTVPIMYWGIWNEDIVKSLWEPHKNTEGYVVRLDGSFHYDDFKYSVAKFVRKDHVQTSEHWLRQPLIKNEWIK